VPFAYTREPKQPLIRARSWFVSRIFENSFEKKAVSRKSLLVHNYVSAAESAPIELVQANKQHDESLATQQWSPMVPKVLDPHSMFGMTCVQCGNHLIAPEKSEHLVDGRIRHLWHCPNCRVRFEAFLRFPAMAKSVKDLGRAGRGAAAEGPSGRFHLCRKPHLVGRRQTGLLPLYGSWRGPRNTAAGFSLPATIR
jgi:hypothetical protein